MSDFEYINKRYKLNADKGMRVKYTGGSKEQLGTIVGTSGPYLNVLLDGDTFSTPMHPEWKLELIDPLGSEDKNDKG